MLKVVGLGVCQKPVTGGGGGNKSSPAIHISAWEHDWRLIHKAKMIYVTIWVFVPLVTLTSDTVFRVRSLKQSPFLYIFDYFNMGTDVDVTFWQFSFVVTWDEIYIKVVELVEFYNFLPWFDLLCLGSRDMAGSVGSAAILEYDVIFN